MNDALTLFEDLGYTQPARRVNASDLNLPEFLLDCRVARLGRSARTGYGLVVAEAAALPRSLRPLARILQRQIHDRPLAAIGVRDDGGAWRQMIVLRPRRVSGQLGAVTVARLDIDLAHPTGHDAEVLNLLRWQPDVSDDTAQTAVDDALDVERVTRAFYSGLVPHFHALEDAIEGCRARNVVVAGAIDSAGGRRRVAIRILTQLLFCYFLQRKDLLAGERRYLSRAFEDRRGPYYPTVLEPLIYDVLAKPAGEREGTLRHLDIPFLNGGLFERRYGPVSLDLPDPVFDLDSGLLGYLDHWTFTVAEERADEQEVAVDPEMLGRIFKSLLPDYEREREGTYYTPRPVVQFMCREALVASLSPDPEIGERTMRTLLVEEEPLEVLRDSHEVGRLRRVLRRLNERLDSLTVLDPAVGSGAFLLGMLGEVVRLRSIAHLAIHGRHPTEEQIQAWKLHAIERTLFGVDIEPVAVELCRLRLWLSLAVELGSARPVPPLPNLEYRTICANSLVDFVEGAAIQDTRGGELPLGDPVADQVVDLRAQYFQAADPGEKAKLRGRLLEAENTLLGSWLAGKRAELGRHPTAQRRLHELEKALRSSDREYPVFMPGFSAPDVWRDGGWDLVIMNPPYVGRKEIPQRHSEAYVQALINHYGATNDTMILFALRALQLANPRGVVAMIFNDSVFTSTDGTDLRRTLFASTTVTASARTKCFEGQAVNGGVIVARRGMDPEVPLRWVEGYRRPVADFAAASAVMEAKSPGMPASAGAMEVYETPRERYTVLPQRPFYRPSLPALALLDRFREAMRTSSITAAEDWDLLSNTRTLDHRIESLRRTGFYQRLRPGEFVLLGLVIEGGQGLATADDRRFLGAIEGTDAAADHLQMQERLERATLDSDFGTEYRSLLRLHRTREAALLALWDAHGADHRRPLPWPHTGTFRIVSEAQVFRRTLTDAKRRNVVLRGISDRACWVPLEKGDQSQEIEAEGGRTSRIGAAWWRDNPLVIDWSSEAVALLRRRAAAKGAQSPRLQNEDMWFREGVTFNRVASYLRCRLVPAGGIFGDKAPLVRPRPGIVPWLSPYALLTLLNGDVADFVLRTFLGSRMMIEVGDLRRLPIPVLSAAQTAELEALAAHAIDARRSVTLHGNDSLARVTSEVNASVRRLYDVSADADLWVVR